MAPPASLRADILVELVEGKSAPKKVRVHVATHEKYAKCTTHSYTRDPLTQKRVRCNSLDEGGFDWPSSLIGTHTKPDSHRRKTGKGRCCLDGRRRAAAQVGRGRGRVASDKFGQGYRRC